MCKVNSGPPPHLFKSGFFLARTTRYSKVSTFEDTFQMKQYISHVHRNNLGKLEHPRHDAYAVLKYILIGKDLAWGFHFREFVSSVLKIP